MNKSQPISSSMLVQILFVTTIIIVDIMKDSFYLLAKTLQISRSEEFHFGDSLD